MNSSLRSSLYSLKSLLPSTLESLDLERGSTTKPDMPEPQSYNDNQLEPTDRDLPKLPPLPSDANIDFHDVYIATKDLDG